MTYVILILIGFIAGVLSAGYVASAIGGLRTDLASAKLRLSTLESSFTAEIAALKAKLP